MTNVYYSKAISILLMTLQRSTDQCDQYQVVISSSPNLLTCAQAEP